MTESRSMASWECRGEGLEGEMTKGHEATWGAEEHVILAVVMVSLGTCKCHNQSNCILYKYVPLVIYQLFISKTVLKNKFE